MPLTRFRDKLILDLASSPESRKAYLLVALEEFEVDKDIAAFCAALDDVKAAARRVVKTKFLSPKKRGSGSKKPTPSHIASPTVGRLPKKSPTKH